LKAAVEGEIESELIQIEAQAALLIADEYPDGVDSEVGVPSVQAD
jgi:hypothetical protein